MKHLEKQRNWRLDLLMVKQMATLMDFHSLVLVMVKSRQMHSEKQMEIPMEILKLKRKEKLIVKQTVILIVKWNH